MAKAPAQVSGGGKSSDQVLDIDFEELYASFQKEGGEGLTSAEIRNLTGWEEKKTRAFIQRAVAAGKCRVTRKIVHNIIGVRTPVPAYIFEV